MIGATASLISRTIGHTFDRLLTAPIDSWIGANNAPFAMTAGYAAWSQRPVMLPGAADIINAYQRGWFKNTADVTKWLSYLGVAFKSLPKTRAMQNKGGLLTMWDAVARSTEAQPDIATVMLAFQRGVIDYATWARLMLRNNANEWGWNQVADMLWEVPQINDILRAWNMGLIDEGQFRDLVRRSGIDRELYPLIFESSVDVPSANEYQLLWNTGRIDRTTYRNGIKRAGADVAKYEALSAVQWQGLGITELMVSRNRQLIDDTEFRRRLGQIGFFRTEEQDAADRLRELIPGPSDLVRFGVYHVFQPEIANALLLYDERPSELDRWHDASGLHRPLDFKIRGDGIERVAKWADLYWGAHWRKLGADTLATFLHRFRPDQIDRYRRLGFAVDHFDMAKMRTLLRMDDYPKWSRDYLAAVSYRPPDFRWVMRGINTEVYNAKDSTNAFLDHGYAQDTAEDMTRILLKQKEMRDELPLQAFARKMASNAIREVGRAYKIGTITRATADSAVKKFDLERAFLDPMFDAIDLGVSNDLLTKVVSAVRKSYLSGASAEDEALSALLRAGIAQPRAINYIAGWNAERSASRKMVTAEKLLSWLQRGLISYDAAAIRLKNLGYTNVDTLLLLAESQEKIDKAAAAQMERDDRTRAKQAKELESQRNKLEQARVKIERRIAQLTPISKLQKWYAHERISREYFLNRLLAMGIPADVRLQLERDAIEDRAKLLATVEKKAAADQKKGLNNAVSTTPAGPDTQTTPKA